MVKYQVLKSCTLKSLREIGLNFDIHGLKFNLNKLVGTLKHNVFSCCRVWSEKNVEEPQRNHQEHSGRHRLPRANHLQEHSQACPGLDSAHHHWQTRLW